MCYTGFMNTPLSIRTVCCKLTVDAATDQALTETALAFNAAATYCAAVAWEQGITNKNTLHHVVYRETRARFDLGAQLACCARDKAAEAVRAARANGSETCPTFRPDSSIRYDARTYRLLSLDRVSLNTLSGRVEAQLLLGEFQRQYLYDLSWDIGGAELVKRQQVWYLCLTQSKAAPDPHEPTGWMGVDLGIVNLATTDDNTHFLGQHVQQLRTRRFNHRQRLQTANTRRARWRLRQIAKKEHRFQKDVNHCISKALIAKAVLACKALKLEELTHIRKRVTVRHAQRRTHSAWAFRQLRTFIAYKALLAGVVVDYIDPRNTSRTCSQLDCGYCDKRNRKDQAHFVCLKCGFAAPADQNAAINISRAARQSASCAAPPTGGGASTSPGALALGN